MKEEADELVRLYKAKEEKLNALSYSEIIEVLTLVPDKWFQKYCSEYFHAFEYLVWAADEIKKVGKILAKPAPEKGKTITNETLHLVTSVYEDDDLIDAIDDFIGDFVKDSQFLILGEIQSFHWSKEQCKLHPLVLYYLETHGSFQHDSLCFIFDDNNHNTSLLYQVQTVLVDYLKANRPYKKN